MRGLVSQFRLLRPSSLEEAMGLLGQCRPIAGGTDLMVLFESGKLAAGTFFSLLGIPELRAIDVNADRVRLGATVTYTQIRRDPTMQAEFPILTAAAAETGGIAIQNRGTIGGNIINASPAADSPPGLLVYDATVILQGPGGERRVPYEKFHLDYKRMDLQEDELLVAVELPRITPGKRVHYFRKIGTRKAQAISKVVAAGVADIEDGEVRQARFALGSIGPTVVRLAAVENEICGARDAGALRQAVADSIRPLDDVRSNRQYRMAVAMNTALEFAERIAQA